MRTPTVRRLAVPALAAVIALAGLAGCGDDGGDDDAAGSSTTTTTTEASDDGTSTTTAATDDGPTTTEEGSTEPGTTATTDGGTSDPSEPSGGDPGTVTPDEEAPDVSWNLNAAQYRGQDGKLVAFSCPPDGVLGSVWGTGTYTDDSSVCSAAVHAGLINTVEGGRVVVEIAPGEESYEGTEANTVTSQDYGSWDGSFTFPEA